jgi:hypothetical protein
VVYLPAKNGIGQLRTQLIASLALKLSTLPFPNHFIIYSTYTPVDYCPDYLR